MKKADPKAKAKQQKSEKKAKAFLTVIVCLVAICTAAVVAVGAFTDVFKQREEDSSISLILFVMCHQIIKMIIDITFYRQSTIIFLYHPYCCRQGFFRETEKLIRQIKFRNHSPCHCIAMKHWFAHLHRITFKRMTNCMSEIQDFTQALLCRVDFNNFFLANKAFKKLF